MFPRLCVNIDHIATLRNARGAPYPCPIEGAKICQDAGAQGITLHLREDRRHIKDADVFAMMHAVDIPINLEMAQTDEMLEIAKKARPHYVCLVPEKRQELTTEGGLDVCGAKNLPQYIQKLQDLGIVVSLFIDPDPAQIDAAIQAGTNAIELHTGAYAQYDLAKNTTAKQNEWLRIKNAVEYAKPHDIIINAGHGLTRQNVGAIAKIDGLYDLNIGHAIIADAVFMGLYEAVRAMQKAFYI